MAPSVGKRETTRPALSSRGVASARESCGGGELQALAEGDDVILLVALGLPEIHRTAVESHDLDVDLWAAELPQRVLGVVDEHAADALAATIRRNSGRIDPSAVAVVPGHDAANDVVLIVDGQPEQAIVPFQLALDVAARIAMRLCWILVLGEHLAPQGAGGVDIIGSARANGNHELILCHKQMISQGIS